MRRDHFGTGRPALGPALVCAWLAVGAAGCQGGAWTRRPAAVDPQLASANPSAERPSADPDAPRDPSVSQASAETTADGQPMPSVTDAATSPAPEAEKRGWAGLRLGRSGWSAGRSDLNTAVDPTTAAEFEAAEKLYLQGDLDGAEKGFAKIARKEKSPLPRLFADALAPDSERSKSTWGMKSLYYLGEIKFQKGDYVGAHDKFEELIKSYPGTNYLEKAVQREYEIGQVWLAHSSGTTDDPLPWHSRFRGGLPVFDTGGHAVAALDHVRLNDPTGPLADDAVMNVADHFYKVGDFETAAEYYDQLSSDHPKSPFVERAMHGSVDSKLKGYIGPEYDVTGLEQARDTARRTIQLFPESQGLEGVGVTDLNKTLDLVADEEAGRAFSVGSYYRRSGHVISAEYYFGMILRKWPKTDWASKAELQLAELAKMPHKQSMPSKMMSRPGQDPFSSNSAVMGGSTSVSGMSSMGGMGGMGGMAPTGP